MRIGSLVAALSLLIAAIASAQPSRFARMDGWGTLRWGMSGEEVRVALRRLGARCTEDSATGYFPGPGDELGGHRTFDHFRCRWGGRELQADLEGYRLEEVRVVRRGLTEPAARARLAALERRHGPHHHVHHNPAPSWVWRNGTTELTLHVIRNPYGTDWFATESWRSLR